MFERQNSDHVPCFLFPFLCSRSRIAGDGYRGPPSDSGVRGSGMSNAMVASATGSGSGGAGGSSSCSGRSNNAERRNERPPLLQPPSAGLLPIPTQYGATAGVAAAPAAATASTEPTGGNNPFHPSKNTNNTNNIGGGNIGINNNANINRYATMIYKCIDDRLSPSTEVGCDHVQFSDVRMWISIYAYLCTIPLCRLFPGETYVI